MPYHTGEGGGLYLTLFVNKTRNPEANAGHLAGLTLENVAFQHVAFQLEILSI